MITFQNTFKLYLQYISDTDQEGEGNSGDDADAKKSAQTRSTTREALYDLNEKQGSTSRQSDSAGDDQDKSYGSAVLSDEELDNGGEQEGSAASGSKKRNTAGGKSSRGTVEDDIQEEEEAEGYEDEGGQADAWPQASASKIASSLTGEEEAEQEGNGQAAGGEEEDSRGAADGDDGLEGGAHEGEAEDDGDPADGEGDEDNLGTEAEEGGAASGSKTETLRKVASMTTGGSQNASKSSVPSVSKGEGEEEEADTRDETLSRSRRPSDSIKWSSDMPPSDTSGAKKTQQSPSMSRTGSGIRSSTAKGRSTVDNDQKGSADQVPAEEYEQESKKGSQSGGQPPVVKANDDESKGARSKKHSTLDNVYSENPSQDYSHTHGTSGRSKPSKPDESLYPSDNPSAYTDAPKASNATSGSETRLSRSSRPSFPSQSQFMEKDEEYEEQEGEKQGEDGENHADQSKDSKAKSVPGEESAGKQGMKESIESTQFVKDRESHMQESTSSSQYPDDSEKDGTTRSRSMQNTTIKMSPASSAADPESSRSERVNSEYGTSEEGASIYRSDENNSLTCPRIHM